MIETTLQLIIVTLVTALCLASMVAACVFITYMGVIALRFLGVDI